MDYSTTIGRAGIRDFLPIAEIDRSAWKQSRKGEVIPDGEHVWRIWVEHALVFAARQEEKVVGAIVAFPCMSGIYFVHKVFVDAVSRRSGIGTRLLHALLDETDRMQVDCFMTVDPRNEALINLYAGLGFSGKEFVRGFYQPDEDRYVLTRRFKKVEGVGR